MGGQTFETTAFGEDVKEAFENAKELARDENGHREGYSGDIQRKSGYILIDPGRKDPINYGRDIRDTHPEISDKFSDKCGAIVLKGKRAQQYRERYDLNGKKGVVVFFFGRAQC